MKEFMLIFRNAGSNDFVNLLKKLKASGWTGLAELPRRVNYWVETDCIRHFNFFAKTIMRKAYADQQYFDKHMYRHLETKKNRKGSWVFPREIVGSKEWLENL